MPVENFLEECRQVMRLKRFSYRTEETYLPVIRRFLEFHGGRTHPRDMGAAEIRAYLSHLALEQHVAASTQPDGSTRRTWSRGAKSLGRDRVDSQPLRSGNRRRAL